MARSNSRSQGVSPNEYSTDSKSGMPIKSLFSSIEDTVVDEIKKADDYVKQLQSDNRTKNWDRYYGKPFGNEKKGRSKFMSRDVIETVEWIMPSLMSTFVSSDPKVEITIEGQPPIVGKALMEKIQTDLNDDDERSLYILLYQWFKDALVSDTAFISEGWNTLTKTSQVRFPQANYQQLQLIIEQPDMELQEYTDNGDGTYSDIDVDVEDVVESSLIVENLPHWDVLVSKDAKFMNDEYGKGYRSKVTLDYLLRVNRDYKEEEGKNFFTGLNKLKYYLQNDRSIDNSEYSSYMDGAEDTSGVQSAYSIFDGMDDKLDPKQTLSIVQWYTRVDINNDGLLEDIKCWVAEDEILLRWEENDDDAIMISALSPIIDCYKLFGIAYVDLITDLQNLKTMIIRRVLDNFDFSTLGRTFVKPGGKVPIRELLENIPGDTILMDPGKVETQYPQPFDSRILSLIEYIDGMKENRTGSTRYNQGTDADSLNKTATGMDMIQQAGQKRIDMICRLFAETGIRDFYKKCALLYRKNMREPFTVTILGEQIEVKPEQLQGKISCKVNLGVEAQIGMAEAKKIQAIFQFLATLNQIFPGIIGPEEIHNLAAKFVANMGNKNPDSYVATMEEFIQSLKVNQEQAQKAQQFQQMIETEKIKTERMKVQIAAQKAGVDLKDVLLGNQTRIRTKQMDIARQTKADKLRFIADMTKARISAQTAMQTARMGMMDRAAA